MDILNDLTKCNFYYYILRTNKAYLIFNYLKLTKDNICIGDAFIRRQNITLNNKVVRFLNKNIKRQYKVLKDLNQLKLITDINLNDELVKYSKLGYLLVVQYLVSNGANIHDNHNWSLGWAAQNGHLNVVQYLISNGANIHAKNDYALRYASQNGHLAVVQYLVQNGANIHVFNGEALVDAAGNNHLQIVQYLVSIGSNINIIALYRADSHGHSEVAQYLISVKANT